MNPSPSNWYVVYTKPRREQVALENLEHQAFECFLPMALNPYQRQRRSRARRREPLFPRYLFLRACPDTQSLAAVHSTRGAIGLVRSGIEAATVQEGVISVIRRRIDPDEGVVRLEPTPLQPGDRVRIFNGPFSGLDGIFQRRSGTERSLLLLDLLGGTARVEVNSLLLERMA